MLPCWAKEKITRFWVHLLLFFLHHDTFKLSSQPRSKLDGNGAAQAAHRTPGTVGVGWRDHALACHTLCLWGKGNECITPPITHPNRTQTHASPSPPLAHVRARTSLVPSWVWGRLDGLAVSAARGAAPPAVVPSANQGPHPGPRIELVRDRLWVRSNHGQTRRTRGKKA